MRRVLSAVHSWMLVKLLCSLLSQYSTSLSGCSITTQGSNTLLSYFNWIFRYLYFICIFIFLTTFFFYSIFLKDLDFLFFTFSKHACYWRHFLFRCGSKVTHLQYRPKQRQLGFFFCHHWVPGVFKSRMGGPSYVEPAPSVMVLQLSLVPCQPLANAPADSLLTCCSSSSFYRTLLKAAAVWCSSSLYLL